LDLIQITVTSCDVVETAWCMFDLTLAHELLYFKFIFKEKTKSNLMSYGISTFMLWRSWWAMGLLFAIFS
jgi:hypothetical protein